MWDTYSLVEKACKTRAFPNASEVDIANIALREWRETKTVALRAFNFDSGHLKSYWGM